MVVAAMRAVSLSLEAMAIATDADLLFLTEPTRAQQAATAAYTALDTAEQHIEAAVAKLSELVKHIEQNWDEAYEEHLRQYGLRGALFIAADYKAQLDQIHRALLHLKAQRNKPNELRPSVGSPVRALCRACADYLAFEEHIAHLSSVAHDGHELRHARNRKSRPRSRRSSTSNRSR